MKKELDFPQIIISLLLKNEQNSSKVLTLSTKCNKLYVFTVSGSKVIDQ